MDEGVVEGCEDSGNAKHKLACDVLVHTAMSDLGSFTFSDLRAERDVFLSWTSDFLGWHLDRD